MVYIVSLNKNTLKVFKQIRRQIHNRILPAPQIPHSIRGLSPPPPPPPPFPAAQLLQTFLVCWQENCNPIELLVPCLPPLPPESTGRHLGSVPPLASAAKPAPPDLIELLRRRWLHPPAWERTALSHFCTAIISFRF